MPAPTLDDVFAVMTAVVAGDRTARVPLPNALNLDDTATRFAVELNFLLDKFTSEIAELAAQFRQMAELRRVR
jgi:hypothetical protein